jgi:hypothetical protein
MNRDNRDIEGFTGFKYFKHYFRIEVLKSKSEVIRGKEKVGDDGMTVKHVGDGKFNVKVVVSVFHVGIVK